MAVSFPVSSPGDAQVVSLPLLFTCSITERLTHGVVGISFGNGLLLFSSPLYFEYNLKEVVKECH